MDHNPMSRERIRELIVILEGKKGRALLCKGLTAGRCGRSERVGESTFWNQRCKFIPARIINGCWSHWVKFQLISELLCLRLCP